MCVYIYIYIRICVHIYICIHIYIFTRHIQKRIDLILIKTYLLSLGETHPRARAHSARRTRARHIHIVHIHTSNIHTHIHTHTYTRTYTRALAFHSRLLPLVSFRASASRSVCAIALSSANVYVQAAISIRVVHKSRQSSRCALREREKRKQLEGKNASGTEYRVVDLATDRRVDSQTVRKKLTPPVYSMHQDIHSYTLPSIHSVYVHVARLTFVVPFETRGLDGRSLKQLQRRKDAGKTQQGSASIASLALGSDASVGFGVTLGSRPQFYVLDTKWSLELQRNEGSVKLPFQPFPCLASFCNFPLLRFKSVKWCYFFVKTDSSQINIVIKTMMIILLL